MRSNATLASDSEYSLSGFEASLALGSDIISALTCIRILYNIETVYSTETIWMNPKQVKQHAIESILSHAHMHTILTSMSLEGDHPDLVNICIHTLPPIVMWPVQNMCMIRVNCETGEQISLHEMMIWQAFTELSYDISIHITGTCVNLNYYMKLTMFICLSFCVC